MFEKLDALGESLHGMTLQGLHLEHPGEVHFDDFDWKRRPSKRRNHNTVRPIWTVDVIL